MSYCCAQWSLTILFTKWDRVLPYARCWFIDLMSEFEHIVLPSLLNRMLSRLHSKFRYEIKWIRNQIYRVVCVKWLGFFYYTKIYADLCFIKNNVQISPFLSSHLFIHIHIRQNFYLVLISCLKRKIPFNGRVPHC